MAFNWKDFAAVFLEKTAENIERRGEEARAYEKEQKEAANRNAELIRNRAAKAKQAASYARKAKMYLGSHPDADMLVKAAMSDGPAEIATLYEKLEAAANQPGQNGKLGQADIDTLINMPELPAIDKKYIDMGLEDFAMQTYGASKDALIRSAEEQEEVGLVGQLFGFGSKQRVDEKLGEQQYGMGMSISDINDLAEQAEYQNIIKDASLTYGTMDRFVLDDYIKFDAVLTKAMKDALDTNEALLEKITLEVSAEAAAEEKKRLQRTAVDGLIKASVDQDVNLLKSVPATQRIAAIMGQDYLDQLYIDNNIFTEKQIKEMRGEGGTGAAAEGGTGTGAAAAEPTTAEPTTAEPAVTGAVTPRPESTIDPLDLNAPIDSDAEQEWDRKYGGKYDPITGAPIIAGRRPASDEYRQERRVAGGRMRNISLQSEWDDKYGDTHDPETGYPLPVEE